MNELVKKIALLTTGFAIGVVVGRKKSKGNKMFTIANSDGETVCEFDANGIRLYNPNNKLIGQVPILDLDVHSLQGERLRFVQNLLQRDK